MNLSALRREPRTTPAFGDRRRAEASALLSSAAARAAVARHGTPLLLLEPERVRRQYRRLREALPFVGFHYAVKALAHDAVLDVLDDAGCGFDIATGEELAMLTRRGVDTSRIIHTHPIKKPAEIAEALAAGVRTFVVDNASRSTSSGVRRRTRGCWCGWRTAARTRRATCRRSSASDPSRLRVSSRARSPPA